MMKRSSSSFDGISKRIAIISPVTPRRLARNGAMPSHGAIAEEIGVNQSTVSRARKRTDADEERKLTSSGEEVDKRTGRALDRIAAVAGNEKAAPKAARRRFQINAASSRGHPERGLQRPPDGGLANLIFSRQRGHSLTCSVARGDLAALAGVERRGATEHLALLAGLSNAFVGAGEDQRSLELGNAAQHREHQLAGRCGGVAPCLSEAHEAAAGLLQLMHDVGWSRLERASRSRRVTTTVSPALKARIRRLNSGRPSTFLPEPSYLWAGRGNWGQFPS